MNIQKPEKEWLDKDGRLEVFSIFRSIQGEGPFVGMPAVFVRLAGCNLACAFCDTDYSSHRTVMTVDEVIGRVGGLAPRGLVPRGELVVLTGGEPLRQNVDPLVRGLISLGYLVQIETNGTMERPGLCAEVSVVCSPKLGGRIHPGIVRYVMAWKYIIRSCGVEGFDGLPVGIDRPPMLCSATRIFVQPMDEGDPGKNEANRVAAVDSCMKFGYRLSLQIHKLLGME